MYPQTLARPYANAAFALCEGGIAHAEQWLAFLQDGAELIQTKTEHGQTPVVSFLSDPRISSEDKAKTFNVLFAKAGGRKLMSGQQAEYVGSFIQSLAHADRLSLLPHISAHFAERLAQQKGEFTVHIESAYPLGESTQQGLRQRLEKIFNAKLTAKVSTNPSLIGGFLARVGNRVLDCSLASTLEKARIAFTR